jgi:hypothetical protein
MATETYKKHTHREHILELPDTYIGSIETADETRWLYGAVEGKMTHRRIRFNPGFYKIFDEIIVNARDALVRSQQDVSRIPVKRIDVTVGPSADGRFTITVKNDGDGIPIQQHETEKCWIPELIFGHLLTSSNYNKDEEKIVGGKNGYGSKCLESSTEIPLWNGDIVMAKDIKVGDVLIGDDGTPRNVQRVFHGKGQLYNVDQVNADSYTVNDQHTLTLYMPDHKVIFWNETKSAWSVLWWDHKTMHIKQKSAVIQQTKIQCPECNTILSGNLGRHYGRVHKGIEVPFMDRK